MISPNASLHHPRRASSIFLLAITISAAHLAAKEPATQPDMDTQYRAVLTTMKNPDTTGVLITELGPDSAAGADGAHAGDIITSYAGRNVTNLKDIRTQVAEVLASRVVENKNTKLLLGVRRGKDDIVLQIDPAPLGIRAIEVEAGVPAPLNPPPSLRGTVNLAWNQVPSHDADHPDYLRTSDQPAAAWLGFIRRSFTFAEQTISGEIFIAHIDPGDTPGTGGGGSIASTDTLSFHLLTGDYKTSAPFLLDEFSITTEGDGQKTVTAATRAGPTLRRTTTTTMTERNYAPQNAETPFPANALLQPLAPLVAAAMSKEKDAVLTLTLTSIRDFISRPGYILISRGQQKLPASSTTTAWQVDLMHCGVVVESYWFDDHHELLRIDINSATGVASTHAPSREAAELPLTKKSPAIQK